MDQSKNQQLGQEGLKDSGTVSCSSCHGEIKSKARDDSSSCGCEHHKSTPRSAEQIKLLKNRINRISGQLGGIAGMIEDNRYCGDILIQIAAVESAVQNLGYLILQDHMETCVAEQVAAGNPDIMKETMELVKKLK